MSASFAVRRSALVLHTLPLGDRQAVLQQLNAEQRDRLTPLLHELHELGMPADQGLLEQTLAAMPERMGRRASDAGDVCPQPCLHEALLAGLAPEQAAVLLQNQPMELAARLLASRSWNWAPEALGLLEPSKRRRIEAMNYAGRELAPKLSQAVMRYMAGQAAVLPVKAVTQEARMDRGIIRRFVQRIFGIAIRRRAVGKP